MLRQAVGRKRRLFGVRMALAVGGLGTLSGLALAHAAPAPSPAPRPAQPGTDPKVELNRAAQELLTKRCVACHGAGKQGGLDLRTRESSLAGGGRGVGLVPGKPEQSALYLFTTGKGAVKMPPNGALTAAEQDLLRRWIASGAEWPTAAGKPEGAGGPSLWSLRPLARPAAPRVRNAAWVRNPIDAFVLSRLEKERFTPAPEADPHTLIRRVTFDLTGLPPTSEETAQFLREIAAERARRQSGDAAYRRLVDRLLASPAYGERWGRHWLDVARFAESQGFERDKIRDHSWRYRDWVIAAMNSDLPYDRFMREQIAGDCLPNATSESIIASGFLVAGPWDEVGHTQASAIMRARVREDELEEMVGAVSQTFLGLTVNCARCHDHKFDPIPQADYYRLQAALSGVKPGDRPTLTPAEIVRRAEQAAATRKQVEGLEAQVQRLDDLAYSRVVGKGAAGPERTPPVRPVLRWTFETGLADSIAGVPLRLAGGAAVSRGRLVLNGKDGKAQSGPLPVPLTAKTLETWVTLSALDQHGGSALTVEDPVGQAFDAVVFGERQPRQWMAGSENFRRTRDVGTAESASAETPVHMVITYAADGRITLYRNGKPYSESYVPSGERATHAFPAGTSHILIGQRHTGAGGAAWLAGEIEEARLYDRALTPEEIAASFAAGPSKVDEAAMRAALTPEERQSRAATVERVERLRAELRTAQELPLTYAVNSQTAPVVKRLNRGDLLQPKEVVPPAGLSCVPGGDFGLAPDAPDAERRRRLAEWLCSPTNPLPARVMANRLWQGHFGKGLVASSSDFGANGDVPSHPELLDWLGTELRNNGWSLKHLHRLMVTSSTYRQSSVWRAPNPQSATRNPQLTDADNRLLWRWSPRRLDAEELRDAVLAVSGQLNRQAGGPGFRPFSVYINNSHFYTYEDRVGPEYNRRSVYRTVVNSGGIPLLETFDCPDPSVKTPRRSVTTTPLQALTLLNNSFVLRQAKQLAKGVEARSGATVERRVEDAYQRVFGRKPTPVEALRSAAFVQEFGLPAFCRVLLNAGEFVYVR